VAGAADILVLTGNCKWFCSWTWCEFDRASSL